MIDLLLLLMLWTDCGAWALSFHTCDRAAAPVIVTTEQAP